MASDTKHHSEGPSVTERPMEGSRATMAQRATQRAALVKWTSESNGTHFITLATNAASPQSQLGWMIGASREQTFRSMNSLLKVWDKRVSRKICGRKWLRSERRIKSICFLEGSGRNPHWHLIASVPSDVGIEELRDIVTTIWSTIVPSGSVDVQEIDDLTRVAEYVTKEQNLDQSVDFLAFLPPQ